MAITRLWRCPPDLGEHGKRLWESVGPRLAEAGSLEELDRETFILLCRTYHRMMMLDKLLEDEGYVVKGENKTQKKHPAFSEWKSYSDLYVKLLSHFGLSPTSRGAKIHPKEPDNGKRRFFK